MLSIAAISSSQDAAAYYQHLAQRDDYYLGSGEPPGRWVGAAAETLGLDGAITGEQFHAVLAGRDPDTGAPRVHGAGVSHRPGWDATFSAPKSVSALWASANAAERESIAAAHDAAVDSALGLLEAEAATARRGRAGGSHERAAGLIAAVYKHSTSRAQEPQLHSHAVIANMAPRTDGSWGALESRDLYKWKMTAGAAYRAELAAALAARGYAIEADGDSFAVAGVPADLLRAWSTRTAEINATGQTTTKGRETAALASRTQKESIDRPALYARWQAEAVAHGLGREQCDGLRRAQTDDRVVTRRARTDAELRSALTERTAVFDRRDVVRAAAVEAQYDGSGLAAARERAKRILADREVLRLYDSTGGVRYTTREMRAIEARIRDTTQARSVERGHRCDVSALAASTADRHLSDEQQAAVTYLLRDSGGVAALVGDAGTGKSYTLGAARAGWQAAGYQVRGAALSGKAAASLQDGSGIQSQTLHSLLDGLDRGFDQLDKKDIVVLDEAGMVGARQLAALSDHVRAAGAKLVLAGDHKQLQPIAAGAGFRHVVEVTDAARLIDIRRQQNAVDRQMVRDFANGNAARALATLADRGDLRAAVTVEAAREAMVATWAAERDPGRPDETLMIAGTRRDVAALNRAAREQIGQTGEVVTLGDKPEAGTLAVADGERLVCTRNSRLYGVRNGDLGTVTQRETHADGTAVLSLALDRGGTATLDTAEYNYLQYGYAVTAHKSQGTTVDHAHVLVDEAMSDREWSYVAASRARHGTVIHADAPTAAELDRLMHRSRQAESSLDHEVASA